MPFSEEVAARLAKSTKDGEERGEGTTIDQIREHLDEITDLLDELEPAQS